MSEYDRVLERVKNALEGDDINETLAAIQDYKAEWNKNEAGNQFYHLVDYRKISQKIAEKMDSFPLNEIMKHPNVVEMISNNDLANLLVTQGDCLDDKTFAKLANRILTDKDMMSKVILAGSPRVDFEKIKSMVLKSVDTAAISKFGMLYEERCDLSPIYRRICDLTYGIKLNSKLKQQRLKDLEKLQPFYEVNRKRIKLNKRAEILELYSR